MSNHPNRGKKTAASNPTPDEIRETRDEFNFTQTEAAAMVRTTLRNWQQWEAGDRRMHPGLWELFQIKGYEEFNRRGLEKLHLSHPVKIGTAPEIYFVSKRRHDAGEVFLKQYVPVGEDGVRYEDAGWHQVSTLQIPRRAEYEAAACYGSGRHRKDVDRVATDDELVDEAFDSIENTKRTSKRFSCGTPDEAFRWGKVYKELAAPAAGYKVEGVRLTIFGGEADFAMFMMYGEGTYLQMYQEPERLPRAVKF